MTIPGMDVRIRYRSVTGGSRIGSDFCDRYPVGLRRWGFFFGDAAGHHIDTISTALLACYTMRSAGLRIDQTGQGLLRFHDALNATPDSVFCSALAGSIEMTKEGHQGIRLANAGLQRPIHIALSAATSIEEVARLGSIGHAEKGNFSLMG